MSQLIYSILALVLIMFLSMNMQRGVSRTQQEQGVNEVGTQLTGVGTEVLERIGRTHFDQFTYDNSGPDDKPYCGRVWNGRETIDFHIPGTNVCPDFETCGYIEGFDGLTVPPVTRADFEFNVTVDSVRYVNPADYDDIFSTQTFAKRVWVTVENPYLYLGDDPSNTFSLTVDRVFTYGCVTDINSVPFLRPSDPACPADPCAVRY